MTVDPEVPRKGYVVKYHRSPVRGSRIEYMRLAIPAEVRQMESGLWLQLWGYKCRANGDPYNIHPSARFLPAAEVEIVTAGRKPEDPT